MSLTGSAGGAVEPLGNGCRLTAVVSGDVVGFAFVGTDGSLVVQRDVVHITTMIKRRMNFLITITSRGGNLIL